MIGQRWYLMAVEVLHLLKEMRLKRETKKPFYLKDYLSNVDLRSSTVHHKKITKKFKYKNDEPDFLDWWGWVILNIRSKMDHTVAKNFSLCVGIINPRFLVRLFDKFEERKKKRNLRIKINGRKYFAENYCWRFGDLESILPHESDKKIYRNCCKELIKLELIWIRFKFNSYTKILSCSGKFKSSLISEGEWREI